MPGDPRAVPVEERKRMRRIVLLVWMILAAAASQPARGAEVLVFAAASLTEALKEIGRLYEQRAPDHITFNFDASSTLARQIAEGAPADVFFSADQAKMDGLVSKHLIVDATRRNVLSNALVVVAGKDTALRITAPDQLAAPEIHRLALADPEAVPAGIYAKAFLEKRGLWGAVSNRVVPLQNVRAALSVVGSGNAEIGFVYRTDAAVSKDVRILYEVPPEDCPPITYPVAVTRAAPQADSARAFLHFLETPEAAAAFRRNGFTVLAP